MAKAQELMEQNPELSKAVTELEEQTLEEQVLAKLKEIEAILTKLDGDSIDLSVFLDQIQSFSDEKKAELQALVDKLDNPLGEKTITMSTITRNQYTNAPLAYQEVWKKDGKITKYGNFFLKGFVDDYSLGVTEGANHLVIPFPNDIEFDLLCISPYSFFARPKAGQRDKAGISGSLDNLLFVLGQGATGILGNGRTDTQRTPAYHTFPSRVKKIDVYCHGDNGNSGAFCLLENGDLFVSGAQPNGIFGIGNTTQVNTWTKSKDNVSNFFIGSTTAFCVSGNTIYGAGYNGIGQIGIGDRQTKTTWVQVKSGIANPEKVLISTNYENHSSGNYASTLFLIDGLLYGAGYNGGNNIIAQSTSDQTSMIRVTDSIGNPLETPDGTQFIMHPLETVILIPNGENMDLYTGGNGIYGHGDSTSGSKKISKVRTFEGKDWKIQSNFSPCSYGDQIECFMICSETKQEAYAWGVNTGGKLGFGWIGDERQMHKVQLPKGKDFEIQLQICNGTDTGGIVCIVDGEMYACGDGSYERVPLSCSIFSKIPTK